MPNAVVIEHEILIDCGVPFKALAAEWKTLKLVLLTHIHCDHFQPSTLRLLASNRPMIYRYILSFSCSDILSTNCTAVRYFSVEPKPVKNVKGLVYRLRQKFSIISDEPLILSSASGYQLNPELHIMTDYQRFDELVSSAVRASSVINKVDILKNALGLYHGKILSSADGV